MSKSTIRARDIGLYIGVLILTSSVIVRAAPDFYLVKYEWAAYWGPILYLALFLTERVISKRFSFYPHIYLVIQSLLTLVLLQFDPFFDYFAVQFVGLCIQVVWILPKRTALIWVGILAVLVVIGLVVGDGVGGIAYSIPYLVICALLTFFGLVTLDAEKARNEAQKLLTELQIANRKLQDYAQQVEDLAAIQQRNVLARELHDSVTQTIFSMTLTAQAARMLLDRDPARVGKQLEHLQELSQNALAEMRSLIQQMRPKPMAEEGLVEALRRHCAERQKNDGLSVDLQVTGDQRLPLQTEEALFRIIQEALNNIVKHSGTRQAIIRLNLHDTTYRVVIEDTGKGFDPSRLQNSNDHIGLHSMEERARSIGAAFSIESTPGAGTRIHIEGVRPQEALNG